jgi:hypothetical protein
VLQINRLTVISICKAWYIAHQVRFEVYSFVLVDAHWTVMMRLSAGFANLYC